MFTMHSENEMVEGDVETDEVSDGEEMSDLDYFDDLRARQKDEREEEDARWDRAGW
jgi:hypothetical protein